MTAVLMHSVHFLPHLQQRAVYRLARDRRPAVSMLDARAVAQSLHTRIPQAVEHLVFSGMRVSLSWFLVSSFTGDANLEDSAAIALTVSKIYLEGHMTSTRQHNVVPYAVSLVRSDNALDYSLGSCIT